MRVSGSGLTVACLANQFPAAVEPYVGEEIDELRQRGVTVIPGTVRKPPATKQSSLPGPSASQVLCLQSLQAVPLLRALCLVAWRWKRIADLLTRVLMQGKESPKRRLKALMHTLLGAYYAALLEKRGVDHIYVHHGYFGSWIGMVAARLLGVSFSLTLYGSDLLLDGAYLDTKLKHCLFCMTISEFNRSYIQEHFPGIDPAKIIVSRLGVDMPEHAEPPPAAGPGAKFTLLTVGRLHAVKDHAFLIRACARLRDDGLDFECAIAGSGPEREHLESLIQEHRLGDRVHLLGYVPSAQIDSLYRRTHVVVLTSRSEGIPLVLMEAMARGKIVLAPAITGIPELLNSGEAGFLYSPGSLDDFVEKVLLLHGLMRAEHQSSTTRLDWIRHAARIQILHNFNHRKNLTQFGDCFLQRITTRDPSTQNWSALHEDFVLQ